MIFPKEFVVLLDLLLAGLYFLNRSIYVHVSRLGQHVKFTLFGIVLVGIGFDVFQLRRVLFQVSIHPNGSTNQGSKKCQSDQ